MTIRLRVNETTHEVDVSPDTPLLYVLTNELELKGPRFGCGLAQCGSCSVLLDGAEIRSCVYPVAAVQGKEITTLEGLPRLYARQRGLPQAPALHPLQQAFVDEQAPQCGYCYNGMAVKGAELLANNRNPDEAQIRAALAGHLCRCGTYPRIVSAIRRAAAAIEEKK
jgi:aerobic-type carbon monoxide dehydrogenase small subunit (CoxS/CutS family)